MSDQDISYECPNCGTVYLEYGRKTFCSAIRPSTPTSK